MLQFYVPGTFSWTRWHNLIHALHLCAHEPYCTALLHRCAAPSPLHHCTAAPLHRCSSNSCNCIASRAAATVTRPTFCFAASARRLPSVSCEDQASCISSSAGAPMTLSSCFFIRSFLHESAFSLASATRSSFCAARARARRPYLFDSLAPLRSVSHLRSALPAAAVLPGKHSYHRVRRHF